MKELHSPLTEQELKALDDFLASPVREDTTMDVATLEGYLVALGTGPETVMPSDWLPWVWDMHGGKAEAQFQDLDEANHTLQLIMRFNNQLLQQFADSPEEFEPVYWRSPVWGAAEWCEGFLLGISLTQEAWTPLMVGHTGWFAPFMRLGTSEGLAITDKKGDAEHWMNEVTPALAQIHAFWLVHRRQLLAEDVIREPVVRASPKIGRNEPCPCGSGKKYKKCCGAGGNTLH